MKLLQLALHALADVVDSLLTIRPLDQVQISQLEDNLHPNHPQRLISSASHLLSQLTHFAGVVATPRRKNQRFLPARAWQALEVLIVLLPASERHAGAGRSAHAGADRAARRPEGR